MTNQIMQGFFEQQKQVASIFGGKWPIGRCTDTLTFILSAFIFPKLLNQLSLYLLLLGFGLLIEP